MFATVGCDDPDALGVVLARRQAFHEAVARGVATREANHDDWLKPLVRIAATASVTPWFVPMQGAIDDGLCLAAEPRGLRAILPIGIDAARERARRDGMLAVRAVRTIGAADGADSEDERLALGLMLEALALPEEDGRVLSAEAHVPIASLDIPTDLDPRTAKAMIAGGFTLALLDGVDDREREAVLTIARRLGISDEEVHEALSRAEAAVARRTPIGLSTLDAVRYVLAPYGEDALPLVRLAAALALPPRLRDEQLRILDTHAPTPLTTEHDLDRDAQRSVLRAAWAAALALDPTTSLRARLLERHGRVAAHLRVGRLADSARVAVDDAVAEALSRGVEAAGV